MANLTEGLSRLRETAVQLARADAREGQLIFFFQFLQAGGRWEEFLRDCPLHYTGNRGSGALNVMGTVLLSVLSGHWRYAHINALRGDGINPGLLGMGGIDETTGLD